MLVERGEADFGPGEERVEGVACHRPVPQRSKMNGMERRVDGVELGGRRDPKWNWRNDAE